MRGRWGRDFKSVMTRSGHISGCIEVPGIHDAVAVKRATSATTTGVTVGSVQRDGASVLSETAYPAYLSVQPYAYCTRCDMNTTTFRVPE